MAIIIAKLTIATKIKTTTATIIMLIITMKIITIIK